MASPVKAPLLLLPILVGIQVILSSALTEEEKLRAALSDPTKSSFQLISNIKLTKTLPPIELKDGATRKFKLFSLKGYTISGAKKFRGLWTKIDIKTPTSFLDLTIDKVNLVDFRAKDQRGLDPIAAEGGWGFVGAAVRVTGSVKIYNSDVSKNQAELQGAIFVQEGSLLLKKCNFTSNFAREGGGAVAHNPSRRGATLTVEDCLFIGNKVRAKNSALRLFARGGALYVTNDAATTIRITRTSFKSNTAFAGGAFFTFSYRSPVVFTSCNFESNLAVGTDAEDGAAEGGAIHCVGVNRLTFVRTTFSNNAMNAVPNNIFIFGNPGDDMNSPTTITGLSAADAALVKGTTPGGKFIIQ